MEISFSEPALATTEENIIYKQTNFLPFDKPLKNTLFYRPERPVNFGDGELRELLCSVMNFRNKRFFTIALFRQDGSGSMTHSEFPRNNTSIVEIRYGDINKDSDIDIAVKLINGAIYVFHNLSK